MRYSTLSQLLQEAALLASEGRPYSRLLHKYVREYNRYVRVNRKRWRLMTYPAAEHVMYKILYGQY